MEDLDLRDGYGDGRPPPVVHAAPMLADGQLPRLLPCCLRETLDMPGDTVLARDPALVTCQGKSVWHRGDRLIVRETGQGGVVEGWKDDKLLVFWGSMNGQDYRSWVREVECDWAPQPKDSSPGTKGLDSGGRSSV
jgi:hypothetical protein